MKKILRGLALTFAMVPLLPVYAAEPVAAPFTIKVANSVLFDMTRFGEKLVAVGERGLVMQSTDEGKTWVGVLAGTGRTLNTVLYLGDKTGLAAGHGGTMMRTADDGATWTAVKIAEIGTDSILGLSALSDGRVLAYGAFGMYLESSDKGKTWTRKTIIKEGYEKHISKVVDIGGGKLFLVGEAGSIAISTDMGGTWKELKSPYDGEGSFFGVMKMTDEALVMYGMRGHVYRSTDLGNSWTQIPMETTNGFNGGSSTADGRVVLVGNGGLIAESTDGGHTFAMQFSKEGRPLGQALYAKDGALIYVGFMATGRIEAKTQKH